MVEGTCRRRQIGGRDPASVTLIAWTVRAGAMWALGLARLVAMAVIVPDARTASLTVVTMISREDQVRGRTGAQPVYSGVELYYGL